MVRLPPPLSPETTMCAGSTPSDAALAWTHFRPETQSLRPAGKRRHLRRGRRPRGVAEIDHGDHHALGGDDAAPGAVHAVERRHRLHPAAVDVIDARQHGVGVRPDHVDLDRVAVGLRGETVGLDAQARAEAPGPRCPSSGKTRPEPEPPAPPARSPPPPGSPPDRRRPPPAASRAACPQDRLDARIDAGIES